MPKLTEIDRTSFQTNVKNWASRHGNALLGTADAQARHNIRLTANKIFKTWRMYLQYNPTLTGSNVDLANFINAEFGNDKLAKLYNLLPKGFLPRRRRLQRSPAQPAPVAQPGRPVPTAPPAQPAPTPATTEGRRRNGRLVEATPNQTVPPVQPQATPQATAAPQQAARPQAPAQPSSRRTTQPPVLNRAQIDQVFVALARLLLASGEAQVGPRQREQDDGGYRSGRGARPASDGGGSGMSITQLMDVPITGDALNGAIKKLRADPGAMKHIAQILPATIKEIMHTYPRDVSATMMLMLLSAAQGQ